MWQKIDDQLRWDKFIGSSARSRFLQCWAWGEFQASLGRPVLRLSWGDEVFVQTIKMKLPGGFAYWYIPHGPVVISGAKLPAGAWEELVKMLGEHGALFLRVDPVVAIPSSARRGRGGVMLVPATQPQCTLVLDLSLSTDALLSATHQKTRYNIKLAEKKGVQIREGSIEDYIRLHHETIRRDGFTSHPDSYYRSMIKALDGNFVKIWQAVHQDKVLAGAIVFYFGDTATYAHGASSSQDRNLMAPYLLHWQIIQEAQKSKFKYYDWWGVNPPWDKPVAPRVHLGADEHRPIYKKSWEGITRFKRGFGGKMACYPSSFDLIYHSTWYRLYKILSRVKRLTI